MTELRFIYLYSFLMLQYNKYFYHQSFLAYITRNHRICLIVDYMESKEVTFFKVQGT